MTASKALFLFVLVASAKNSFGLIQNDWETLAREVTIRYFSPSRYVSSDDPDEIWNNMGENITCRIDDDNQVSISVPETFDALKPFKVFTHGFASRIKGDGKTEFVSAWMSSSNKEDNVILVDWSVLASFTGFDGWDNYVYDFAARNSIDVGEFLGMCLAGLSNRFQISGGQIHLAGHSLGSHLMGKAARTFQMNQDSQELIGRLTGLDPAGPRFVDGPYVDAIPELAENILTKESAAFVDVIHSNGGFEPCVVCPTTEFRSGTILQLGHMDFYPSGGSAQPGCMFGIDARPGGLCSHRRAIYYFLHSIWEHNLFPSMTCQEVEMCNNEITNSEEVVAYMGELAPNYYTGTRQLFYNEIKDCHWDYYTHNNFLCFGDEKSQK